MGRGSLDRSVAVFILVISTARSLLDGTAGVSETEDAWSSSGYGAASLSLNVSTEVSLKRAFRPTDLPVLFPIFARVFMLITGPFLNDDICRLIIIGLQFVDTAPHEMVAKKVVWRKFRELTLATSV